MTSRIISTERMWHEEVCDCRKSRPARNLCVVSVADTPRPSGAYFVAASVAATRKRRLDVDSGPFTQMADHQLTDHRLSVDEI